MKRNVGALEVKVVGRVEAGRIVTWGGRRPGAGRPIYFNKETKLMSGPLMRLGLEFSPYA